MIVFILLIRSEASSDRAEDKKESSAASYCHKLELIRTLLQESEVPRSRICTELGLYTTSSVHFVLSGMASVLCDFFI